MTFLVTVKLPRRPEHDPSHKVTGRCPVPGGGTCTDVTGQHHTVLVHADTIDLAALSLGIAGHHITRVESLA